VNNTIKKNEYIDKIQMNLDLTNFLIYYIIYRRHGGLRKELNVKTPFDAIENGLKLNLKYFYKILRILKIKLQI